MNKLLFVDIKKYYVDELHYVLNLCCTEQIKPVIFINDKRHSSVCFFMFLYRKKNPNVKMSVAIYIKGCIVKTNWFYLYYNVQIWIIICVYFVMCLFSY